MTKIVFFFENTAKIQNIFSCSLRISSIFGKYGVLRGYTLIIYKEVSYFFMLLFMMIFFAASEIKVEEINALCKQTSAYGDSLSSSLQADVLFYILDVYFIFTGLSNPYPPWRRHRSLTIHSLPSLPCR